MLKKPNTLFANIEILLAFILTLILAFISGWRDFGLDREQYITLVGYIRSTDEFYEQLFYAKELNFLVISNIAIYFSTEVKLVFLILCFISLVTKYFAVKKISPEHVFIFILLYAIFLSTGLEFAAMRGGLSIGFLFLAIAFQEKIWPCFIFCILSITSHTAILPLILLLIPKINEYLNRNKYGYFIIIILTATIGNQLIYRSSHGAIYYENFGTLLAYTVPLATLLIAKMIFYQSDNHIYLKLDNSDSKFLSTTKPLIYGCISIALGITNTVVVASTRYLEISWCLLLLYSIITYKNTFINLMGMISLLVFLSYMNIIRSTWLALFQ